MKKRTKKETVKMISQRDLRALMTQCASYEDRAATANGHSGELVREALEKKNLHRGAFAIIKRLHRMGRVDGSKLWLLLQHFDDYREKLGLDKLAREQGQLLPSGVDNETNVTRIRAREVGETAGEAAE